MALWLINRKDWRPWKKKKFDCWWLFANTKSLIDTDDKLQDDITFTNVTILITCVLKDNGKFYLHIFLDKALLSKHDILQDGGIGASQKIRKEK